MRVRPWILWLAVAAAAVGLAWSRLAPAEQRLGGGERSTAPGEAQADDMHAAPHGPTLVGVEGARERGGEEVGPVVGAPPEALHTPAIELHVVDGAGRNVPNFTALCGQHAALGHQGEAMLALAGPGEVAPPGPYGVLVFRASDEAGVAMDLGAAYVRVPTCGGGPVRVVLPVVDALTIHVRDEAGAPVAGAPVRMVTNATSEGDASANAPSWPTVLGPVSLDGTTGADGSVRLARAASNLTVNVACDTAGFLACGAQDVKPATRRVELELRRGRAVELTVESPWGAVGGARVVLTSDEHAGGVLGPYHEQRAADDRGRVRFEWLDPRARYVLLAHPPGWEAPSTRFDDTLSSTRPLERPRGEHRAAPLAPLVIPAWVPSDTTLRLHPAVRLQGVVRDGYGVAVTDAIVEVQAGGRHVGKLETDGEGRFTWDEPPQGVLDLHVAAGLGDEHALQRTVAVTERGGLVLQIDDLAQRVLDVTFPDADAREAAAGFLGALQVAVRVAAADGAWGPFQSAHPQVVPLADAATPRARVRVPGLARAARAEALLWLQDVGFAYVPLPAPGANADARLEPGEAVELVTARARRGDDWRVRLTAERYAGLELDVFVAPDTDGQLRVGGLPAGTWRVHAAPFDLFDRARDRDTGAQRFEGALEAEAPTGTRTVPTEVPPPAR